MRRGPQSGGGALLQSRRGGRASKSFDVPLLRRYRDPETAPARAAGFATPELHHSERPRRRIEERDPDVVKDLLEAAGERVRVPVRERSLLPARGRRTRGRGR